MKRYGQAFNTKISLLYCPSIVIQPPASSEANIASVTTQLKLTANETQTLE